MPAQYAPAPPMTTASPSFVCVNIRGCKPSGSSGAGVNTSPLSQQCPTIIYSSIPRSSSSVGTTAIGCCAPYMLGRITSVIPVSVLINLYPSFPVSTTSIAVATIAPAFATRYVPGSTSRRNGRPVCLAVISKASAMCCPIICKSVDTSPGMRPILYPPPRLNVVALSNPMQIFNDINATRSHTSGSLPDPICVCMVVMVKSRCLQILWTSEIYSCQIPKLAAGPPTLVRLLCPDPMPGLMRTERELPGNRSP